jgi:hypothetical protein
MGGTIGRPNLLAGWNTYDWPKEVNYVPSGFTAMTAANVGRQNGEFTVTFLGQYATGSQIGVVWGFYPNGYGCKSKLIAGPTGLIRLQDLQPGTVHYCAPIAIGNDGNTYLGTEAQLTTSP